MELMKEVTKDEFYKVIGPLDVVLHTQSPYPYTTEYKIRYGSVVGKVVNSYTDGIQHRWPIVTKYYLTT